MKRFVLVLAAIVAALAVAAPVASAGSYLESAPRQGRRSRPT